MRTAMVVLALVVTGCGVDERGGDGDVTLPESCETNDGCPTGYFCQKANAFTEPFGGKTPAAAKCMARCSGLSEDGCSLPPCSEATAAALKPTRTGFSCPNGQNVLVEPWCEGGVVINVYETRAGGVARIRPWHSTENPCAAWQTPPDPWPFKF